MGKIVEKYLRLRFMRERLGITQEFFANLIECKTPNYANKELGKVPWRLHECQVIRDYINTRLVQLDEPPTTIDELFVLEKVVQKTKA